MSLLGKWRIVAMPDYESDFPDMPEPAYILLGKSGDEFALPVRSTGSFMAMQSSSLGLAMTK